jgi:hypothetical protein
VAEKEIGQSGIGIRMHHIARVYGAIIGVLAFLIIPFLFVLWVSLRADAPAGSAPVVEMLIQLGLILAIFLAWKKELAGGVLLIAGGIGVGVMLYSKAYADNLLWSTVFALPIIIAGALFVISHRSRGRKIPAQTQETV